MQVMTKGEIELFRDILRLCSQNYWIFDRAFAITKKDINGHIHMDDLLTSIPIAEKEIEDEDEKIR